MFVIPVNSSMVNRVTVEPAENLVILEYNTGREYRYLTDTPIQVVRAIQNAEYKGQSVGRLLHSMFADNTLIPENQLGL